MENVSKNRSMMDLFADLTDDLTTYLTLDQSINLSLVSTSSFYRGLNNVRYNRFIPVNNTNLLKLFNRRNSNTKKIIKVIKAGADIKVYDHFGNSLHRAIHYQNIDVLNLLIKLGMDPNNSNRTGISALNRAIDTGNPEIIKILIGAGVNLNPTFNENYYQQIPIEKAIWNDNKEIIRALLLAGANANVSDSEKTTPLHFYSLSKDYDREILDMLIEAGADINAKTTYKETPLEFAKRFRRHKVVSILEELSQ